MHSMPHIALFCRPLHPFVMFVGSLENPLTFHSGNLSRSPALAHEVGERTIAEKLNAVGYKSPSLRAGSPRG